MATAAPSIMMIVMLAFLSMFAATILSRPWQRYVALGCAMVEVFAVAFLLYGIS